MFTDDDLKRLKDFYEDYTDKEAEDIRALLARLEAAENVLSNLKPAGCLWYVYGSSQHDLEAWRKACGK